MNTDLSTVFPLSPLYFPFESDTTPCTCGKIHKKPSPAVFTGRGVIKKLPAVLEAMRVKKPFILADLNTRKAAGDTVCKLLSEANIEFAEYTFPIACPKPEEHTVGAAIMHFDLSCDCVIGVGSGVINDTGKLVSAAAKLPYIIVGTAPSMDGYASATSSMERAGLKSTLNSKCPDVVIGDTDILLTAPDIMLRAGLGDMLAKYTSLAEWRISNIITGEYYCEKIAALVRTALKKCTDNAEKLMKRDPEAVEAVFEGLVIGGVAMNYAGLSRPASGIEHYFSHVWDMRGLEFGTKVSLHGIQCAIGTLISARLYEKLKTMAPDTDKAKKFAASFDVAEWNKTLSAFIGKGADAMIDAEKKDGKYDPAKHAARIEIIAENWDSLVSFINEEIPPSEEFCRILDLIGAPKSVTDIGIDESVLPDSFRATKDIRDKYVLSRLAHDMGVIEELMQFI